MIKNASPPTLRFGVLFLLLTWMLVILPIYWPNMGGGGLALPQNILAWSVMTLAMLMVSLATAFGHLRMLYTPTARLLFISMLLLALPLLYTRPEWREDALWRFAGVLGGWMFYVACLQLRLTSRQRTIALYGLLGAIGIQALLALFQLLVPDLAWVPLRGNRVYAIFQQANVLGSFIATGLALALLLLFSPMSVSTSVGCGRWRQRLLLSLLMVFSALLVLIQSRAGWLGGVLASVLLLWWFGRQRPYDLCLAGFILSLGTIIGLVVLLTGAGMGGKVGFINHDGSNGARLSMLQDTVSMIAERPLLGWGYGGFEYNLLHFRLHNIPGREISEVANHPHNEILLWWVEGGLPALAGMALILATGVSLLRQAWRQDKQLPGGSRVGLFLVLIPMLLHSQLEYPFYLSAPHWLVFLLLLALLDSPNDTWEPLPMARTLSATTAIFLTGTLVMARFAWTGGIALTQAERTMLVNIVPIESMSKPAAWVHRERKAFDEQSHALLVYNQTHNEELLTGYRQWADVYLQCHIDSNIYATLIMILRHQRAVKEANMRRQEAAFFFPRDRRFK